MTLGEKIKSLRKEKGLTQEDLAKQLNVIRGTLSVWEIDRSTPDNEMLIKIADFFGVTVDYLLGREYIGEMAKQFYEAEKQSREKMSKEEIELLAFVKEQSKKLTVAEMKQLLKLSKALARSKDEEE
jgi:transcriptional regulator with XRE-family HTH domain